jgi:hypothetical protein
VDNLEFRTKLIGILKKTPKGNNIATGEMESSVIFEAMSISPTKNIYTRFRKACILLRNTENSKKQLTAVDFENILKCKSL